MKLSVIIPVYNSDKYIMRCLDSIYNEAIPVNEFEVICIDDYSKDNSVNLIKSYSQYQSNLILLLHSRNKKQGAARNFGISQAKGEYIWFIDADDFIERDIIKILFKSVENSKPDILQFNARTLSADGTFKHYDFLDSPLKSTGIDYLNYEMALNYENRIWAVWSKWYKRDFILSNNLFFEEGVFWEDVNHTFRSIYIAQNFTYLPTIGYNYVETPNSDFRGKQTAKKFRDTIHFCLEGLIFLSDNKMESDLKAFLGKRFIQTIDKYKARIVELDFFEFVKCNIILSKLNYKILSQYMPLNRYSWLIRKSEFFICWINRY